MRRTICAAICKCFISAVLFVCAVGLAYAETNPTPEYQLKASYIYNFTKFIEWPHEGLGGPADLIVCVVGSDPFGWAIDELNAKQVRSNTIRIQRLSGDSDLTQCDLAYIGIEDIDTRRDALADLRQRTVLTIGESKDFLQLGGLLRFVTIEDRIRFEINAAAVHQSRLRISARLLNVAILK